MKKVIVTGATGFIGTSLIKKLCDKGIYVYAIVRNISKVSDEVLHCPNIKFIQCDMENLFELPNMIKDDDIDVFFHLAWEGSTGLKRGDYDLQLKNIKWTLDAVTIAKRIGAKKFVGAGSLAEIDVMSYLPQNGTKPNRVSCYGSAKIAAYYMSKSECNYLGIKFCWARISNIYGPGNYTDNFVNFAAKKMLKGEAANFTTAEQFYDFVFIDDAVQGLICIGERGNDGYSYYIGSSKPNKLKFFITIIRDAIDKDIPLYFGAIPFQGVSLPMENFSCNELVRDTNYHPLVNFEEGIKKTIPWIKNNLLKDDILIKKEGNNKNEKKEF